MDKTIVSSQPSTNEWVFKTKVVFKVHNFTQLEGKRVNSDVFSIGSDEWRVSIDLEDIENEKYVGVYLNLVKSLDQTIDAQHDTYLLDMNCKSLVDDLGERQAITNGNGWGTSKLIQYSTLTDQMDDYLPNNTLTISLNIIVWKSLFGLKKRVSFGRSFAIKDLNDCRLVVKGKELFASKAILSSHSEVFESMFLNDMLEKASNEVVIDDIDADVFEQFLRFLYFGNSEELDEMAEQLLYVSDKYMVDDLKEICQNLMYLKINAKNAFKILKLMDKYGNKELMAKTDQFIEDNRLECLQNDWLQNDGNTDPLIRQKVNDWKSDSKSKKSSETLCYTYLVQ